MRVAALLVSLSSALLVSAGVVITPIHADQVVPSNDGDCFFGVSTPQGCGPLRS